MLQQTVTVKPFLGAGAYGDLYGEPYSVRCRIEPRNELVRDQQGVETVATAKMYTFPEVTITVQSIVTWMGREFDVVTVMDEAGPNGRIHHKEVQLR
jgi:hypothetical protein